MEKVFYVPEMSCQYCVGVISKALQTAGFSNYEVLLGSKEVKVVTDSTDKIVALLDDAGYSVELK